MKNGEEEVENTGAETLGQEKKARKRLSFLGHRCFSNHCYSSFANHNANDHRKSITKPLSPSSSSERFLTKSKFQFTNLANILTGP